ncbi:glycosyltransferase family 2 protein [soil metagenome]
MNNIDPVEVLVQHIGDDPNRRYEVFAKLLGPGICRQIGLYPFPPGWKLSVVIPVFNEERWLEGLVERVQAVPVPKELILVNDKSTDGTPAILDKLQAKYSNLKVFHQPVNSGKGAALREGFKHCTGDVVLIQDADWEYDPAEYPKLIQPILDGRADVVFGSRFIGESHRVLYFFHSLANKGLTVLSNVFTDLNLTDMETCYKVFKREVIQSLNLKSDRFGFEPEVTAKVARKEKGQFKWRIYEVPISYSGRTYAEGKKIGLKDAFNALYCVLRYWIAD